MWAHDIDPHGGRRPGEPVPDLLDYRVVHRAMTADLRKPATAAAQLVDRPDPKRMAALRHYLNAVSHEIVSHHRVEDDHVWPFLEAIAGHRTALVPLTEEHERLDPLLHRAGELAARTRSSPELAAALRELADLLARHVSDEERDVFPIITDYVRVEDYQRMQQQFRRNLRPSLLPFLVPWVLGHATAEERPAMLAEADWPLRLLHTLFEPRFRATCVSTVRGERNSRCAACALVSPVVIRASTSASLAVTPAAASAGGSGA